MTTTTTIAADMSEDDTVMVVTPARAPEPGDEFVIEFGEDASAFFDPNGGRSFGFGEDVEIVRFVRLDRHIGLAAIRAWRRGEEARWVVRRGVRGSPRRSYSAGAEVLAAAPVLTPAEW